MQPSRTARPTVTVTVREDAVGVIARRFVLPPVFSAMVVPEGVA